MALQDDKFLKKAICAFAFLTKLCKYLFPNMLNKSSVQLKGAKETCPAQALISLWLHVFAY